MPPPADIGSSLANQARRQVVCREALTPIRCQPVDARADAEKVLRGVSEQRRGLMMIDCG